MSEVQRICSQCGQAGSLEARYCPHCGNDSEQALPVQSRNLPVLVGKAAVPILLGAASLALRIGWRLLHSRWARETARTVAQEAVNRITPRPDHAPTVRPASPPSPGTQVDRAPTPSAKRTIRVTSTWTVGDASGNWQRGASQHTIEIDAAENSTENTAENDGRMYD